VWGGLWAALAVLGLPQFASAAVLFATASSGSPGIFRVDTSTNTITPVTTGTFADGLVFDSSGRIIYTALNNGDVRRFDPNTNNTTILASGFNTVLDITLEPGGNSVLVTDRNAGTITRINLTTLAKSTLPSAVVQDYEGITYDNSGHLFVNVPNLGQIWQLDPTTGAKLNSSPTISGAFLDGLAFDSVTGALFAGGENGNIYQVSTSLASVTPISGIPSADGLTSDSAGNIFVASLNNRIFQYNIGTGTITPLTPVSGLDDLAPASGLGAPPTTVPEPATLTLFALGTLGVTGSVWRRKRSA
jgi:sugar lactone lactonase YvrE